MAENKTEEEILETDTVNEEASSAEEETKEAGNEASAGETEAKEAEEKADKKAEKKECEMHPDSDHLHLCKVDIGSEVLDIVCGAPNARKGIKVIVAQVGAELPGD